MKKVRQIKKTLLTIMMLVCILTVNTTALANDKNEIQSLQVIDLGHGVSYEYALIPDLNRAFQYTSATAYGKFFLTDSGDTVARTQLKVYFKYDGSSVEAYSSNASCEPVASNWAISYSDTVYSSTGVNASGSAVFTLYRNGNYNNSLTAIVYCTKDGITDTVIN